MVTSGLTKWESFETGYAEFLPSVAAASRGTDMQWRVNKVEAGLIPGSPFTTELLILSRTRPTNLRWNQWKCTIYHLGKNTHLVRKENRLVLGGYDSRNSISKISESCNIKTRCYELWHHNYDVTHMETGVCRQHYSMNNLLIFNALHSCSAYIVTCCLSYI